MTVLAGALPFFLFLPLADYWWMYDDPSILRHVLEYPVAGNFFDPGIWRAYSAANFTPLLPLSFALDLHFFGLDPAYFYAHQLLVIAAVGVVGYLLLRQGMPPLAAVATISLISVSPSFASVAQPLMTRHYLEGLLSAMVAVLLFQRSQRSCREAWSWGGAFFYLMACLSKEVYAPLIAIILVLWWLGEPRLPWRAVRPYLLAAAIYAVWRAFMLGPANTLSGYGDLYHPNRDPEPALLAELLRALGAGGWFLPWMVGSLVVVGVMSLVIQRRHDQLALIATFGLMVWIPLAPLYPAMATRHLFVPTIWVYSLVGLGIAAVGAIAARNRRLFPFALTSGILALTLHTSNRAADLQPNEAAERWRAEGSFVLYDARTGTLLHPIGPSWYYEDLRWLRRRVLGNSGGAAVCYNPCFCAHSARDNNYRYSSDRIVADPSPLPNCPSFESRPIAVKLTYDPHRSRLDWELDAGTAGRWFYMQGSTYAGGEVPPQGSMPYVLKDELRLRFMFKATKGWATITPVLTLEPQGSKPELLWSRGSGL